MFLTTLKTCVRNVCLQRHYFISVRTLNIKTVSEPTIQATKKNDQEESQNFPFLDQKTILDNMLTKLQLKFSVQDALGSLIQLKKLSVEGNITPSTLIGQDSFEKICQSFQEGCQKVRVEQLVTGLRCLMELGVPPDSEVVKVVENEVLWNCRKMTMKTLCKCLDFHVRFQETKQQQLVVKELTSLIEKRWCEIEHSFEVVVILKNNKCFPVPFLAKVEDKVLEFADKMNIDEIFLMFSTFSQQKRRPAPVLRALSYYIVQKKETLKLRHCCDLCFALHSLRFLDVNVLNKISHDALLGLETNNNVNLVCSLVKSLSLLKWDDYVLLERCCEWIGNSSSELSTRDWVNVVQSLGHLNFQPENRDLLYSLALQSLKNGQLNLAPSTWLDVVWALAVSGKATPHHLGSVLEPAFYRNLISEKVPNSVINKLKLQNIFAVAKVEFPLARIPSLKLTEFEIPSSAADRKLKQSVVDALKTFLPHPKYLETSLNTNMGFAIIGEFIVDLNGKPVPIVDYGVKAGQKKELKPLPSDCKRIALLVWCFKDLMAKTSNIIGVNSLAVRLLTKLGYTVLEIPCLEFQNLKLTLQQVMYLQQKIKDRVSKT